MKRYFKELSLEAYYAFFIGFIISGIALRTGMLNRDISVVDLLGIITTLSLPWIIKKSFEEDKEVRSILKNDFEEIQSLLVKNESLFLDFKRSPSKKNLGRLQDSVRLYEPRMNTQIEGVSILLGKEHKDCLPTLIGSLDEYHNFISEHVMNQGFKADESFMFRHESLRGKILINIRDVTQRLIRYY